MLTNKELEQLETAHLSSANTHLGQDWQSCKDCAIRALLYDLRNTRSRLETHLRGIDGCSIQDN